jgi:hypothetical protein
LVAADAGSCLSPFMVRAPSDGISAPAATIPAAVTGWIEKPDCYDELCGAFVIGEEYQAAWRV